MVEQDTLNLLSAVSSAATAVGVLLAAYQLWQSRRQGTTTFEDSLTSQYREAIKSIPLDALLGGELTKEHYKAALPAFYRYFDLCNEQVFLHSMGRISNQTWKFWEEGILTNMKRKAFEAAWQEIAARAPEDFDELRVLVPPNALAAHAECEA